MTNAGYHVPGENFAYPPYHFGQNWELYNPETDWNGETMLDYTYQHEGHSVYTIQLFELIESGTFDWSRDELNWKSAAYDNEQYERICAYFIERFRFREISMLPVLEWMYSLRRKLIYELMPKYKPLYERIAEGIQPLSSENEYYKNRTIESAYPETLLSENADYITDGKDEEYQRIKEKGNAEAITQFAQQYKGVDELLLDELEILFIGMYTSHIDGL